MPVSPLASAGVVGQEPIPATQQAVPAPAPTGVEETRPQDQEAYDRVVMAGMKVLYDDDKASSTIVQRLKADSENPAKSLSDTVSMLMIQLDQASGGNIPDEVILPAGAELLRQTSELADSMGIFPVDEAVMNHATQLMVVTLGEEYGATPEQAQEFMGGVTPEETQQAETMQGEYARKQLPVEV